MVLRKKWVGRNRKYVVIRIAATKIEVKIPMNNIKINASLWQSKCHNGNIYLYEYYFFCENLYF